MNVKEQVTKTLNDMMNSMREAVNKYSYFDINEDGRPIEMVSPDNRLLNEDLVKIKDIYSEKLSTIFKNAIKDIMSSKDPQEDDLWCVLRRFNNTFYYYTGTDYDSKMTPKLLENDYFKLTQKQANEVRNKLNALNPTKNWMISKISDVMDDLKVQSAFHF